MKQTFFNLITNAHHAVKDKGTISVRAYPFAENGSSSVRVEVEDKGTGIDPQNLHHIFNPFYTTKESGLGLGLATVHKVVTSHRWADRGGQPVREGSAVYYHPPRYTKEPGETERVASSGRGSDAEIEP